jgi:hypothetical protein
MKGAKDSKAAKRGNSRPVMLHSGNEMWLCEISRTVADFISNVCETTDTPPATVIEQCVKKQIEAVRAEREKIRQEWLAMGDGKPLKTPWSYGKYSRG